MSATGHSSAMFSTVCLFVFVCLLTFFFVFVCFCNFYIIVFCPAVVVRAQMKDSYSFLTPFVQGYSSVPYFSPPSAAIAAAFPSLDYWSNVQLSTLNFDKLTGSAVFIPTVFHKISETPTPHLKQ